MVYDFLARSADLVAIQVQNMLQTRSPNMNISKKMGTEEEVRKVRWNRHDTKKEQASSEHCTDLNAFQNLLAIIEVLCDNFSD